MRVDMKEQELIKQLESARQENASLPPIELESHRSRLKAALLSQGYLNKQKENFNLESLSVRADRTFLGNISGVLTARRPVWQVAFNTMLLMLALFIAFFTIPQTSAFLKSTFFPEGSRTIDGPKLTTEEEREARAILLADSRVTAILVQGAAIDKLLPIEVSMDKINPDTGSTKLVKETWAQAWLVLGSEDWSVQVDLVRGEVVSITP